MERWHKILIGSLAALTVALAAFSLGYSAADSGPTTVIGSARSPRGLSVVEDAFAKIKSLSVESPSNAQLVRGAVRGMAEVVKRSGDDYALYYSPKAYSDFQEITSGKFSGIGVWLKQRNGGLEIVSVLPNTPALEAGLQRGDVIESIDGDSATELSSDQAVTRIKGKAGTEVGLGISRGGERLSFTITRATIDLPNVLSSLTPEGLGYIRLFGFARGAGNQVRTEVANLAEKGAEGFILDMRDNGGGLFSEGVEVASVFIEDGEIVSYRERSQPASVYKAAGDAYEEVPLVVLVNEGTASASEIVTGALQDTERAIVVGTQTYGKGSVQEVLPLTDSSAIKLTIGSYFTPEGTRINGEGIEPDIEVTGDPEVQKQRAIEILQGVVISAHGSQG